MEQSPASVHRWGSRGGEGAGGSEGMPEAEEAMGKAEGEEGKGSQK